MKNHPYVLYIVYAVGPDGTIKSYVGITNNLPGRIRKHRGEIKGGAKFTTRYSKIGWKWELGATVHGFSGHQESLQFEWAIQHPKKSKHLKVRKEWYPDCFVRNVSNAVFLVEKGTYVGHTWATVHSWPEKSHNYVDAFMYEKSSPKLIFEKEYEKFVSLNSPFKTLAPPIPSKPEPKRKSAKKSAMAERYRADAEALLAAARARRFHPLLMTK